MTLYKPGHGRGPAMHLARVKAFKLLEESGLLTFHHYTREDGYVITTVSGDRREVASTEAAAYLLGAFDMFQGVRRHVDEVCGDGALKALEDRFQDTFAEASAAFESQGPA